MHMHKSDYAKINTPIIGSIGVKLHGLIRA